MIDATTFEAQLKYLKLGYTTRHHAELTAAVEKIAAGFHTLSIDEPWTLGAMLG